MRLFVAVVLGEEIERHASAAIERLKPRAPHARFLRPYVLHLTLSFLAYVEQALQPAQGDPYFALQVKPNLGHVPPRPRAYLVRDSTDASQAGPSWVAAHQHTEALITDIPEKEPAMPAGGPGMGGMDY